VVQGGRVRDSVLFSVTAVDWPAVKRGLARRLAGPANDGGAGHGG
jgi:hypothetical protein